MKEVSVTLATPKPLGNERYDEILDAAARCFQTHGFVGASIDLVARSLGATKGRIYHYFPSKIDLFNAVRDKAMALTFEGVGKGYDLDADPLLRLTVMSHHYVRTMIRHQSYMLVLVEGLQMHRFSAMTVEQRDAMVRHLEDRNKVEHLFREVLEAAIAAGQVPGPVPSVTLQSMLMSMAGPVIWYSPREAETVEARAAIADEVVIFVLRGLGVEPSLLAKMVKEGSRS